MSSSNAMEKEGFIRDMNDLNSRNISIKTLVTDRHPQIQKYTRENMENTNHEFDAWHIVKGKDRLIIFGGFLLGCKFPTGIERRVPTIRQPLKAIGCLANLILTLTLP